MFINKATRVIAYRRSSMIEKCIRKREIIFKFLICALANTLLRPIRYFTDVSIVISRYAWLNNCIFRLFNLIASQVWIFIIRFYGFLIVVIDSWSDKCKTVPRSSRTESKVWVFFLGGPTALDIVLHTYIYYYYSERKYCYYK